MKIYYFASQSEKRANRDNQARIKKLLEQAGLVVLTNLQAGSDIATSLRQRANELGQSMLDQMDAIVIEGSGSDPEIGYLLAYGISAKKPTLYFIEQGSQANNPLVFLATKNIPSHVIVKAYTAATLDTAFYEMLGRLENQEFTEAPTIKFTLRITHLIEQYLHWKTHNTKMTKADYLRRLIEEVMKKDESFRKYKKHG
ncbi:MAG: hypothetical protein WC497_01335 [Patescibacteria group bacterium]